MSGLSRLRPALPHDALYPRNVAYMARTDLAQMRLLGYTPFNIEAVTTLLLGLLNGRTTIRHESGVTPPILELFERAGLHIDEDMRTYQTADEAERIADQLVAEGRKLIWPYPLAEGRFPDGAHLVAPDLWRRLNAKSRLGQIVPAEHLAPRRLLRLDEAIDAFFSRPCFVKAAGEDPTGWGYSVWHCPEPHAWRMALEWFAQHGVEPILVEDDIPLRACWCVTLAVGHDRVIYAGAAEQVFGAPGRQSGSVIDPEASPPNAIESLAVQVGEAARELGFLGLAGLDIGLALDGRVFVFDPNFRFNASSTQVLFHAAACERSGLAASASFNALVSSTFEVMADRVTTPIEAGWFVPTRLIDGALLPPAEGRSMCTGFVLGMDRAHAERRAHELTATLSS